MPDEHLEVSIEQDTVVLTLGSSYELSTLHLTIDEAQSLASEIRYGLLADQGDSIVVCDVGLSVSDARVVLLTVEEALGGGDRERLGLGSSHAPNRADWLVEGF